MINSPKTKIEKDIRFWKKKNWWREFERRVRKNLNFSLNSSVGAGVGVGVCVCIGLINRIFCLMIQKYEGEKRIVWHSWKIPKKNCVWQKSNIHSLWNSSITLCVCVSVLVSLLSTKKNDRSLIILIFAVYLYLFLEPILFLGGKEGQFRNYFNFN